MICKNCNSVINDNARFCDKCGAEQLKTDIPTPIAEDTNPNTGKKMKNLLPTLIIVAAVFLVGSFIGKNLIAPSYTDDEENSGYTQDEDNNNDGDSGNINSNTYTSTEFSKVFEERNIIYTTSLFRAPNSAAFVKVSKTDDGVETIGIQEYGYNDNDIVSEMIETIYYSVSGNTEAEKSALIDDFKTTFSEIDSLNCCTFSVRQTSNYIVVNLSYNDVDESSALSELHSVGIVNDTNGISFSATEKTLLEDGFIKK